MADVQDGKRFDHDQRFDYRSRQVPPGPERPGPDAGDGPWTIEFAVEVTPLEA
jgi:hypothetical protein